MNIGYIALSRYSYKHISFVQLIHNTEEFDRTFGQTTLKID
ncbi:hypothetical protein [Rodentibacter caecimuris]